MKHIDFRDAPGDLWKRVEPPLEPFKRKRSGESLPLSQRKVLAGILYKCRSGCFPPAIETSHETVAYVVWKSS